MDALEDGPDFSTALMRELFDALVEKIIVDSNERLRFRLKNGLERQSKSKGHDADGKSEAAVRVSDAHGRDRRNEPEAKAVQDIFLQYTLGASLKGKLQEQMSKTDPPMTKARAGTKIWLLES